MSVPTASELRARLDAAGWSLLRLDENAVVSEGRPLGVAHGLAARGALRGRFATILEYQEGGLFDLLDARSRSPTAVSLRLGAGKLSVDVCDGDAARAELEALLPALRASGTLEALLPAVRANGWTVDRQRCQQFEHDGTSLQVLAARGDELLEVSSVMPSSSSRPRPSIELDDRGQASYRHGHLFATAEVWRRSAAEALASVLAGR